jgi:sugar phosphate isomerase/epimerase
MDEALRQRERRPPGADLMNPTPKAILPMPGRREFLAAAAGLAVPGCFGASRPRIGLSIGNYGMKTMSPAEAMRLCAATGYDGMEVCLMAGWPTEPAALNPQARKEIRRLAGELHLAIPSLLGHLSAVANEEQHKAVLEQIRRGGELGHDLSPSNPPMIQTILGGKPNQWDAEKNRMVDRLGDWAKAGQAVKTRIAVKSHIITAVDTPERLLWLLDQVKSPWVQGIYDYGHFYVLGLDLMTTLEQLLPRSILVTVKDSSGDRANPKWLIPGDGKVDYVAYFKKLQSMRYRGFILVEVSTTIHSRPGYDPVETTKRCYSNLLPALVASGIRKKQA